MDVKEKVLDAIQLMASNSVKNAGYDKTIQAQIVSCQDATIGKYRCRYQDSVFYAYSNNTDMSFSKGADVYILVPGNDFKQEKTILGTTQKLGVNYISQIQKEQSYQQIGINCIDTNDIFYLNSNNTNYKYVIYDHSQDNETFLDITSLNEYIKSSSSLVISADFKTSIPANRQYKGHYGIRFNLAFQDNSSGENVIRSYEINEDNMVGNPYRLAYSTKQDQIFDIDGENFVRVDSIEIFNNSFPNANGNTSSGRLNTGDIEITNLQLFGAVMLTESQLNGVNITFYTPQGSFFTDSSTSTTTKTIVAQVRVKGKLVSAAQNIPFYWGRENARITASDLLYNKHLGRGWQCLNQSNVIQATDGSDPIIEWVPGKDTLYVTFEDSPAENNRYKVAIVYDGTVVTKEINIKNLASIVTRISISSDGGTKFYYDNGHPNLTCKVIAVDGNEETDITSNCNFYWAYQSNTGITTELPVTTADNTRYNNAQQQLNTRLAAIAAGTAYVNASESYIAERQNIIDSYKYIQRVEGNVIHDVQIRNITNFGTFKCSVYNATNNLYYGTAAITLTNTYEGQNLYSLVINNGAVTFQYNEEGIAPNNKSLDTQQQIQALSFTVYDNLGNPIDSNDIINSRNCSVRWYFPIENTLLVDTPQNGQGAGIDAHQQYKYYDNNIVLSYNIATKYDIKKKFNQIKLNVNYKGMNLTTETQFNFIKQGEPGTNGTEYIVKLVPNTRANNVPLYPMVTKVYNNNSTVILNYKINSLEDGQSNINIGSGNSYQLLKAQLWHNGDMVWEGCSIPTEAINGQEVPISIDDDQNVKDQTTRPSMIHWEVLKNQYTNSLSDNSDFQVSNALTGYIYYKGDHLQNNANYLKPYANIIKCSVTWEGKTYYGTIPIITAYVSNSNYRVGLKDYTGFRYVMYTSDGILPKYDTTHPFEFTIKRYISNVWEDISLVAGTNEITYTPSSCGPVSADAVDYEDKVLLQLLDQQYYRYADEREQDSTRKPLNKNQWKYKPKSRYDGECVTTAILCEYKNNNNVVGRINIPVHFLLNKYGLAEINEWDGNSVQINQQGGYILAPQMGAGYKDSNNNFTGVLMGQVKETAKGKTLPEMGLFGYSQGDRTFFLNSQNGAAIFGKANGGQIIIDPSDEIDQVVDGTTTVAVPRNKALLYSDSFWKNYNDDGLPVNYHTSNQKGEGMLIDLSTPAIRWGNGNFFVTEEGYLTARGGGYIAGWLIGAKTLSADNNTITLHSGGDLLNPNQPYDATTNPYLGGRIYSENHNSLTNTNNGFYIDKDGLSIGKMFKVTADGVVTVGNGAVSGSSQKHWTITTSNANDATKDSYISYYTDYYSEEYPNNINNPTDYGMQYAPNASVYLGTNGISLGKGFAVNNDGNVKIRKGSILITGTGEEQVFSVNNRGYLEAKSGTIAGIEMWKHSTVSELRAGTKDLNNNNKLTKGFVLQSTGRVLGIGTQYYDTDQGNILYNLDLILYYLMPESTAAQRQAKTARWNEIQTNISNHYYQQPSYNIWAFNEDSGIFQGGTSDWYNGDYRIQNQHFRIQPANGFAKFMYADIVQALTVGGVLRGTKKNTYNGISRFLNSDQTFSIVCSTGDFETKGNISTTGSGNISSAGWIGAVGNISTSAGSVYAANGWSGNLTVNSGNFSTTGTIGASGSISTTSSLNGHQCWLDGGDGTLHAGQITAATGTLVVLDGRYNNGTRATLDAKVYAVFA